MARIHMFHPAGMAPTERLTAWTRRHRLAGVFVIVGLVVGAVATFAESARTLEGMATEAYRALRGSDPATLARDARLAHVAKLVDAYFAEAMAQPVPDFRPPTPERYAEIEVALRELRMRYTAEQQVERAALAASAIDMLRRISPARGAEVEIWQTGALRAARAEFAELFAALDDTNIH